MRIGILSQWYDPEPGPAAIPAIVARALRDLGHDVTVLTAYPNYPTGRIFPGYRQSLRQTEHVDGIAVTRVPVYASHSGSALGRVTNYGTFALSAWALGGVALRGAEAIWVYNSPATVGIPLGRHSRAGSIPVFLQVQDLWPESVIESGMVPSGLIGRIATRVILRSVRRMEREAAVIGVSSPGMREIIAARHTQTLTIVDSPNPTDEGLFRSGDTSPKIHAATGESDFVLMYAGAIGAAQGLSTVIEAARILGPARGVRIIFVGDGTALPELVESAADLSHVTFAGRVPPTEVPALLQGADAHLVSLGDRPFLRRTTPSKIASLLAAGVPILGHVAGDAADTILRAGAGLVSEPGDPQALAEKINTLREMSSEDLAALGSAGRLYYDEHFSAHAAALRVVGEIERFSRAFR